MAFDPDYFRTKYFVIAAIVAGLLLGGAAAAYLTTDVSWSGDEHGCDTRVAQGTPLDAVPQVTQNESRRRTLEWTIDAASFDAGLLDACVAVGELLVEPSADDKVRIIARIAASASEAVDKTEVVVDVAQSGNQLNLAAYEARVGQARRVFSDDGAELTLIVQLPDRGAWDLRAATAVGDVRASGLMLRDVKASADVGEVRAIDVDLSGNLSAETSVGSIVLSLTSVQSGTIRATSDVDDVEIRLPTRVDVGYDVNAESNVGSVDVRIGDTELYTRQDETVGGDVHARTKGYDEKPARVVVQASANVGDVIVATEA